VADVAGEALVPQLGGPHGFHLLRGDELSAVPLAELQRELGVELALTGTYRTWASAGGPRVRLTLHALDAKSGRELASAAEEDQQDHLVELAARLGARLRAALGLPGVQGTQRKGDVERLLAEGRALRRTYALRDALGRIQRAAELAPQDAE